MQDKFRFDRTVISKHRKGRGKRGNKEEYDVGLSPSLCAAVECVGVRASVYVWVLGLVYMCGVCVYG